MLEGIDISKWQSPVNWDLLINNNNFDFIIIKATEGNLYVDPCYNEYWQALSAYDIIKGAYHYYRPTYSLSGQASNFFSTAPNIQIPPILDVELYQGYANDVEYYNNSSRATIQADLRSMLLRLEEAFGRKPIIYTSAGFWNYYVGNAGWENEYILWVANYGVSTPRLPYAWSKWLMWQYTGTGRVSGISGDVDLNYFNGDMDDLQDLISGTTPPLEIETVVNKLIVVETPTLRIRSQPTTLSTIVGTVSKGMTLVELDEKIISGNTWAKIGYNQWIAKKYGGSQLASYKYREV